MKKEIKVVADIPDEYKDKDADWILVNMFTKPSIRHISSEFIINADNKETNGGFYYEAGTKPIWEIGDGLAYWDDEGLCEKIIGTIIDVKKDTYSNDWEYTVENGECEFRGKNKIDQESLIGNYNAYLTYSHS